MTGRQTAAALIAAMCFATAALAEPVITIRNNGPSGNRIDVAVLGDGYTAAELVSGKYSADVEAAIQGLFAQEPYKEYQHYYNVHRIDVTSVESGADHPELGVYKNTALDATYNCGGIQRLICVNTTKVNTVLTASIAAADARDVILVIVNDPVYGGSGGAVAVASTNSAAVELVLHELGHTFALLADEYTSQPPTCNNSIEPPEPNATRQTIRSSIKWNVWIAATTPVPTTGTALGVPGLYEGAKYCPSGLYRPTYDSKMRSLNRPFEQINVEAHVKRVYNFVTPLDAWSPAPSTFSIVQGRTQVFTADLPTPLTHSLGMAWIVDGVTLGVATPFSLQTAGLSIGNHIVQLTIRDDTTMVRNDPSQVLVTSRVWTVGVVPPFTDDPLTPGTLVKAIHIVELRTRINNVRVNKCGLAAFPFTDSPVTPGVTIVRAVHLLELRSALNEAYTACGRTAPTYTDSLLTAGSTSIRGIHISELRDAVLAIE